MSRRRAMALTVLGALAFGLLAGFFKGDQGDLRGAIGNLSAPWLLVGLVPALGTRTPLRGAVVGLLATLLALVGFYLAVTMVLSGHLGGGGFPRELLVEVDANLRYFAAGALSGPAMGALGGWLGRRHRRAVPYVCGALLVAELVVVTLVQGHQLGVPPVSVTWSRGDWRPYVGESVVGLVLIAAATVRSRRLAARA